MENIAGITFIKWHECMFGHPQIGFFVVSRLFRVARHAESFKVGLKPAELYARLIILLLGCMCVCVRVFTSIVY